MSIASYSNSKFWTILLLGSYDSKTEQVLYNVREEVSRHYMNQRHVILILLLSKIEVYAVDYIDNNTNQRKKFTLIVEMYEKNKITLYKLNPSSIDDMVDITVQSQGDIEVGITRYLETYVGAERTKLTILPKLEFLGTSSLSIFLIRHRELTRGGEYVELVYLLNKLDPNKIFFLKREGFDLSTMALEILDKQGVILRTYRKDSQLIDQVLRTFDNCLSKVE